MSSKKARNELRQVFFKWSTTTAYEEMAKKLALSYPDSAEIEARVSGDLTDSEEEIDDFGLDKGGPENQPGESENEDEEQSAKTKKRSKTPAVKRKS